MLQKCFQWKYLQIKIKTTQNKRIFIKVKCLLYWPFFQSGKLSAICVCFLFCSFIVILMLSAYQSVSAFHFINSLFCALTMTEACLSQNCLFCYFCFQKIVEVFTEMYESIQETLNIISQQLILHTSGFITLVHACQVTQ